MNKMRQHTFIQSRDFPSPLNVLKPYMSFLFHNKHQVICNTEGSPLP